MSSLVVGIINMSLELTNKRGEVGKYDQSGAFDGPVKRTLAWPSPSPVSWSDPHIGKSQSKESLVWSMNER